MFTPSSVASSVQTGPVTLFSSRVDFRHTSLGTECCRESWSVNHLLTEGISLQRGKVFTECVVSFSCCCDKTSGQSNFKRKEGSPPSVFHGGEGAMFGAQGGWSQRMHHALSRFMRMVAHREAQRFVS